MMPRRRITLWMLVFALSVMVLGAFSAAQAEDVITFWNIHTKARGDVWQALVDEFNASRSDVRIEFEQPATGATGVNQLLVAVAAGTPPDLVYLDRGHIDRHKGAGLFEALDPYIERAGWDMETEWFDRTIERLYKGGKLYGLAVDAFPLTYLVWNKRIFDEAGFDAERPPATYDELDQMAMQLNKSLDESSGVVRVGFDPWLSSGMTYYQIWLLLWDTWLWDTETRRVTLTHPRSMALAEWHVGYAQRLQGVRPASWEGNPFVAEQLAMRVAETSTITNLERTDLNFEWGMSSMPLLPWQEVPSLYVAGEGMAMLSGSRRKDQAWTAMEWLLRPEQGARYALETGIPPARISTLKQYATMVEGERERRMLDLILTSQLVAIPSWPIDTAFLRQEVFPTIRNLQKDPRTALSEAEEVLQGRVDEYLDVQGTWW